MNRNDVLALKIKRYCAKILEYCEALTMEEFLGDAKTVDACSLCLIQIGEFVNLLDEPFKEQRPNILWHGWKGLRNRIAHDYEGVIPELVWQIISEDIPELLRQL